MLLKMSKFLLLRTTKGLSFFLKKKSVRTVQPPFSPPLSLLYLAGALEQDGHTVEFLDTAFEENPQEKIRHLLSSLDAVILNMYPGNQEESSSIADFIRSNNPDIPLIIHGLFCTIQQEQALRDIRSADVCIRGEAEHVINEVVKSITGKRMLSEIPGVLYRENNQIKTGKPPGEIKNLDDVPFPARHLAESYEYGKMNGIHLCRPRFTSLLTSRSCPYQCRFCASRFVNGSYRQRSPENVLQEFQEIQDTYGSVMVADDNFLADKKRATKILDGLIASGSTLDLFIVGARVDNADRELYKKMADAGVKFISFGIESGNQDVLNYYNKRITLSQIRNAVDLAREMKMITWGNFIIGAPMETKEHLKNTLKFALSLPLDVVLYRQLSYQRGSTLWEEAVAAGVIDKKTSFCYAGSGNTASNFTAEELSAYCRFATKRFYYRPTYLLRELSQSVARKDFTVFRSLRSVI
jgi:anaerobic magnesium-protoporphyrin IX monomethyl ester cyclase